MFCVVIFFLDLSTYVSVCVSVFFFGIWILMLVWEYGTSWYMSIWGMDRKVFFSFMEVFSLVCIGIGMLYVCVCV